MHGYVSGVSAVLKILMIIYVSFYNLKWSKTKPASCLYGHDIPMNWGTFRNAVLKIEWDEIEDFSTE